MNPVDTNLLKGMSPEDMSALFKSLTIGFKTLGAEAFASARPELKLVPTVSATAALGWLTTATVTAKALKKVLALLPQRQTSSPASQSKFEYTDNDRSNESTLQMVADRSWWLGLVASIIALRFSGSFSAFRPRKWGAAFISANILLWVYRVLEARLKSPIGAVFTTRIVEFTKEAGPLSSSQQRQVFVETPLVQAGHPVENHSHGDAARKRNAGSATAALVAHQLGLEPYFVQMSNSDKRNGRDGDRSYHWAKDLALPSQPFRFDPSKHASVLVDVDEHLDMPHFLAAYPGTHLISTFQPGSAAKAEGDYSFRFGENGKVVYRVSGGAEYEHHVWDYAGDTLIVENPGFVTKLVVAYHVDRKRLDDDHQLIMLSLLAQFKLPSFVPSRFIVEGRQLVRLNPVFGNHVVLDLVKADAIYRSVAIKGQHLSVTKKKMAFDAVHAVAIVAKVPVTPGMVDSNISPAGKNGMPQFKLGPGEAAVVASYIREGVPIFPPVVYPPSECLVPIYYDKNGHDSRVPLAGFGSPLIGPNYAHADDIASDAACIEGRILAFTGREFEDDIPPSVAKYMTEFAKFIVPDELVGTGRPIDHEEVHERQDRPSQRHILDEAESSGPWYKRVFRVFKKKEEYGKETDPRNITTVTPEAKLKNSRYMYEFHDKVMLQLKNYAFNKTPKEIAGFVARLLKGSAKAVMADGSRFDGHVIRRARILERMLMLRFFHKDYHAELNETLDEQIGLPGTTENGYKYASHYTRGSGTLETSDFNSLLTMFIGFCAWRNTEIVVDGIRRKCTFDEACEKLGLYGGDDSIEGAVCEIALKKASRLMGQDYEIEVVYQGNMGVNFLNRYYSRDVFFGDENSMANPKRLLSKLYIGPANLQDPLERFAERAGGYYRMDQNSPVIGPITRVAHILLGDRTEGLLMPWDGKHSIESNWPNQDSGWMYDWFNQCIPDFDHVRFAMWLVQVEASGDASGLLRAPLCTSAPEATAVKRSCVSGQELKLASEVVPDNSLPESDFESEEMPPLESMEKGVSDLLTSAEEKTPVVTDKGVKARTAPLVAVKPKCNHKKVEGYVCPCLWNPPKKNKGEDDAAHAKRIKDWTRKRKFAAGKHNVTLREESQINGNSGSWTNSDDVESAAAASRSDFFQFASDCHRRLDLRAGFLRTLKDFLGEQPRDINTLVAIYEWNGLVRWLKVNDDLSSRAYKARIFSTVVLVLYLCSPHHVDIIASFNALNGSNGSATNTDDHLGLLFVAWFLTFLAGRRRTEIISMSVKINQNNNAQRSRNRAAQAGNRQRKATKEMSALRRLEQRVNALTGSPDPGVNSKFTRDAHIVMSNGGKGSGRPKRRQNKKSEKKSTAAPAFQKFLTANTSAFSTDLAPPFMTFNPQPTLAAQPGRAVSTAVYTVATSTELWFAVGVQDDYSMDGVAYHVGWGTDAGGGAYWLGPYDTNSPGGGLIKGSIGTSSAIAIGGQWTTALGAKTAAYPVRNWPIATTIATGGSGTQRYVPTCWDIHGVNVTPIVSRGGEWLMTLPPASSQIAPAGIGSSDLMLFGSFRETGDAEAHLHVPARPYDLGYRHVGVTDSNGSSTMSNPAGFLIFRNNTTEVQTIRVTLAEKYSIGGTIAAALTKNVDLTPHHAGHYETASSAVTNGLIHPTVIKGAALAAHAATQAGQSALDKVVEYGKTAAKSVITAAIAHAGFGAAPSA